MSSVDCQNGIISCFIEKGLNFTASSSSVYSPSYSPYKVFTPEDNPYFHSLNNSPGEWWEVDFNRNVTLNGYIIRGGSSTQGSRIYNWKVSFSFFSSNPESWPVADSRTNTDVRGIFAHFPFSSPISCRFLRITSTGNDTNNDDYHVFNTFD